jgi:hypothetical protein
MRSLLLVFASFALLLAGCGGGGTSPGGASADGTDASRTPALTPSGPPVSDEEYLKAFCTGVTNYNDAILSKPKEGILQAVKDYIASMERVNPPEDLQSFHQEFLRYLKAAEAEPTDLVVIPPPKPAEPQRERLAKKTANVPECKYPTFLNTSQ